MNQRYTILDYTRIIAAYLVVLGHLLPVSGNVVKNFIYSFHISLFFIVSGMLHKYNGRIQLQKYIKTILIPALFFYFGIGMLLSVMGYFSLFGMDYLSMYRIEQSNDLFSSLCLSFWCDLKKLLMGDYGTNGPCWFLYALLILKIYADISLKNKKALFACLLLCPVLFVFSKHIINPFSLGRAMLAFPFFLCGYYCKDYIIRFFDNLEKKKGLVLSIVFLAISLCCLYFNHQPSYSALKFGILPFPINIICFYLAGISGTLMVMSLCSKWKNYKIVESVANSLITIVGVQALFFKPFLGLCSGKALNLGVYMIVAVLLTLLCWLVHLLLKRAVPFMIGK